MFIILILDFLNLFLIYFMELVLLEILREICFVVGSFIYFLFLWSVICIIIIMIFEIILIKYNLELMVRFVLVVVYILVVVVRLFIDWFLININLVFKKFILLIICVVMWVGFRLIFGVFIILLNLYLEIMIISVEVNVIIKWVCILVFFSLFFFLYLIKVL